MKKMIVPDTYYACEQPKAADIEMCIDKELDDRNYEENSEMRLSLKKAALASIIAFYSLNQNT